MIASVPLIGSVFAFETFVSSVSSVGGTFSAGDASTASAVFILGAKRGNSRSYVARSMSCNAFGVGNFAAAIFTL